MKQASCIVRLFVGVLLASFSPKQAIASGVVGTGTSGTCNEAALDGALAGGGNVTFNCGAQPFTITLSAPKTIGLDTEIDGGGLLTLSGGRKVRLFEISAGVSLTLRNASVTRANGPPPSCTPPYMTCFSGGAIYNQGMLDVTNCVFSDNRGDPGAAIIAFPAPGEGSPSTTVTNCTFVRNGWTSAVFSAGGLTITDTTFSHNRSPSGDGVISNEGDLIVTNSTFVHNSAAGSGGAIDNEGVASVSDCTFTDNRVTNYGAVGGAIANGDGGSPATLTVIDSTFSRNRSGKVDLVSDHSLGGGAIWSGGGTVVVANSTFDHNSTPSIGDGGAIANTATAGPGTLTVLNATFSRNRSRRGGAIYSVGPLSLLNTIIANNSYGGTNCAGSGAITDGGGNLRWPATDTSCVGTFGNPMLAPLADNGGPTPTMALQRGRAAINAGDNAICAAALVNGLDQRAFVRPGIGVTNCSIGAYEYNAVVGP